MIRCRQCGEPIEPGEKIVVQYEAVMEYHNNDANPTDDGTIIRMWHKKCKPWHA